MGPIISHMCSVAIRYVLPVFWMTLCFHVVGPMARHVTLVSIPMRRADGVTAEYYTASILTKFSSMTSTPGGFFFVLSCSLVDSCGQGQSYRMMERLELSTFLQGHPQCLQTSGSAMAEGPRDALSVEILQLQNIPF